MIFILSTEQAVTNDEPEKKAPSDQGSSRSESPLPQQQPRQTENGTSRRRKRKRQLKSKTYMNDEGFMGKIQCPPFTEFALPPSLQRGYYTILTQKEPPFVYLSLKKGTPFKHLHRNGASLFYTLETKLMFEKFIQVPFKYLNETFPHSFVYLKLRYMKPTKRFKIGSNICIIQSCMSNAFCLRCDIK